MHQDLIHEVIPRMPICHEADFETRLEESTKYFMMHGVDLREMLLMKSDFILLEVMASNRLISTITELVNDERYATSESTVKTGTADRLQTKHPAYQRSNWC